MNLELFWSAISGITGILSIVFMLFIEWPRVKTRLGEAQSAIQQLIFFVVLILGALGIILFATSMFSLISSLAQGYPRDNSVAERGQLGLSFACAAIGIVLVSEPLLSKSKGKGVPWISLGLGIVQIAFSIYLLMLVFQP